MQAPAHLPVVRRSGFTLLEIVVVIAILAVMAAIVVSSVMGRVNAGREARTRHDIQAIGSALRLYRHDNYRYPTQAQGLAALVQKPDRAPIPIHWRPGGYLNHLPLDPWHRAYHYRNPGLHGQIDIYTLGRDGEPGGQGADADIGNWMIGSTNRDGNP